MTVATRPGGQMEHLLFEIKKVIVGQDHLLERMIVALLARGHLWWRACPVWRRRSR
jgi:MoxR-like ATPase